MKQDVMLCTQFSACGLVEKGFGFPNGSDSSVFYFEGKNIDAMSIRKSFGSLGEERIR